jgi:phosphatidylserine/phosphatidylglycerophosphate/cardiolipin synthase-like enzyme
MSILTDWRGCFHSTFALSRSRPMGYSIAAKTDPEDRPMLHLTTMDYLMLATGFLGAWTLLHLAHRLSLAWRAAPSVACHFSPKGGCAEAIIQEIRKARHEILVLAYSFTERPIAQSLVDAKARGVHVEILLDHSNEKEAHTELNFFMEQSLAPLVDAQHPIAHNKVMVIDSRTLITGSFNFTNEAENANAENLLILKGHPELIVAYRKNFADHKAHSRTPVLQAAAPTTIPHPQHRAA